MPKSRPLTDLEADLALNAAYRLLHDYTTSYLPESRAAKPPEDLLFEYVYRWHAYIFQETHYRIWQDCAEGKRYPPPDKILAQACKKLASVLYAQDGMLNHNQSAEAIAPALAELYLALYQTPLFEYGAKLVGMAAAVLMARAVGVLLDFRRLEAAEVNDLIAAKPASPARLTEIICVAADTSRDRRTQLLAPVLNPQEREYWEELHDYYRDTKCGWTCPLYLRSETERPYMVLTNGGLWPLEVAKDRPLDQIFVDVEEIKYYLPSVRKETILAQAKGKVQPYRLWVDHLTGLTIGHDGQQGELDCLMRLFDAFRGSYPERSRFIGNERDYLLIPELVNELAGYATTHPFYGVTETMLRRAAEQIRNLRRMITKRVEEKFDPVRATPVDHPRYYVTMGGSGAGKNGQIERAQGECGGNAIVASLDEAREFFEGYFGGVGGGLDYPQLELASLIVRKEIISRAKAQNYNLIRDCSGVPAIREKAFLDSAKLECKPPRQTFIYAVTTDVEESMRRSLWRYRAKGRWVEPNIVRRKHAEVSRESSLLMGYKHSDVFVLVDNNGSRRQEYTIAEMFRMNDATLKLLTRAKSKNQLRQAVENNGLGPSWQHDHDLDRPEYKGKTLDFLVLHDQSMADGSKQYTVVMIYDLAAYLHFLHKGHFNEAGRDPQQLRTNPFPFIPGFVPEEVKEYRGAWVV